jgi:hypothetical protein
MAYDADAEDIAFEDVDLFIPDHMLFDILVNQAKISDDGDILVSSTVRQIESCDELINHQTMELQQQQLAYSCCELSSHQTIDLQPQQQVVSFDDLLVMDFQPRQVVYSCYELSNNQTMDLPPQQQVDSFDDLPDPQPQQLDDSCDDLSDQQTMDMRQPQQLDDSCDDLSDQQTMDMRQPQQLDVSCDDLSDQQTMDMRQPQQLDVSCDDSSDQLAMDPQQQQVDDSCDVQSVDSDDSDIKIIDNDVKPFSGNMFVKKRYSTANTPLFAAKNAMPFILNKILFSRKGSIEKTTEKLLQGAKTALAKYMESGKYGIYVNFVDVPSEDSFGSEFDKIYTHAAIVETLNANGYSLTEVKMLTDLNYLMTTNVTIIVYGTTNSSFHIDDYSIRTTRHVQECNHVVLIKNKVMHCIFLKNTGQLGMIAKKYMNVAHNKGWKKTRGNSYLDIIKAAFVVQKK